MTPLDARRELFALRSDNEYFTEAQCRRANELHDIIEAHMATKTIGKTKVTTKDGKTKVSPIITAPKTARIAKAKKAAAKVKGLVKNRVASKAKKSA